VEDENISLQGASSFYPSVRVPARWRVSPEQVMQLSQLNSRHTAPAPILILTCCRYLLQLQ
jgi:hypothetical protein